jgi:tRNA-Thr(GGU) m(6)t(6)A37 methyltransferase TsaA
MTHDATRPGEIEAPLPERADARVVFIGTIRTPFQTRDDCPRQGKADGPLCRIELQDPWKPALKGIERFGRIEVLYWMHQARRDLILQSPKSNGEAFGTFALRSPVRPNPIATSMVELVAVEDGVLVVRGLDCIDGTPLVDLKPDRCAYTPLAPPNPGELTEASS